jgi:hypothetical protein
MSVAGAAQAHWHWHENVPGVKPHWARLRACPSNHAEGSFPGMKKLLQHERSTTNAATATAASASTTGSRWFNWKWFHDSSNHKVSPSPSPSPSPSQVPVPLKSAPSSAHVITSPASLPPSGILVPSSHSSDLPTSPQPALLPLERVPHSPTFSSSAVTLNECCAPTTPRLRTSRAEWVSRKSNVSVYY